MTSKDAATNRTISEAVFRATRFEHVIGYESVLRRIQDEDMLNRDLTRTERNMVRAWFDLGPEISETEQCA